MRIELSRFIDCDLEEIGDFIARDNPNRAKSFVAELRMAAAAVGKDPEIYALRPDLGPNVRVSVVGRYLVVFRIMESYVRIDRIVHGARDMSKLTF